MTKSEIFKRAHKVAKNIMEGDYIARLALALKEIYSWIETIEFNRQGKMFKVVEAKLHKMGKHSTAENYHSSRELSFKTFMHKVGAYYGVEISDEIGSTRVFVSEKAWEDAINWEPKGGM